MSEAEQDLIEKFIQKTGGFAKDMTLRDYFAAKAMQALGGPGTSSSYPDRMNESIIAGYAKECYAMADAMLEASRA